MEEITKTEVFEQFENEIKNFFCIYKARHILIPKIMEDFKNCSLEEIEHHYLNDDVKYFYLHELRQKYLYIIKQV